MTAAFKCDQCGEAHTGNAPVTIRDKRAYGSVDGEYCGNECVTEAGIRAVYDVGWQRGDGGGGGADALAELQALVESHYLRVVAERERWRVIRETHAAS